MLLISPDFLEIALSDTLPPHLESYKISNSKILFGSTTKGDYLFQNLCTKSYHACFINLFSLDEHKVIVLKKAPSFYLLVQLKSTLDCSFHNLPNSIYYEWSINLFYANNAYAEISLQKLKDYSTFILFIPQDVVKHFSKDFPLIEKFYELQKEGTTINRLFKSNPICNFKLMDLIAVLQSGKYAALKTYIELIKSAFELFTKKTIARQSHVENTILEKIYSLNDYLATNKTENFKRGELCKQFNISVYHFEKGFSKIYNASPFLLLRYYRMTAIKNELQNNNTPLKELAGKYHYSYNSLIRAFQSIYKIHPTKFYRKNSPKSPSSNRFSRINQFTNYPKRGKK